MIGNTHIAEQGLVTTDWN